MEKELTLEQYLKDSRTDELNFLIKMYSRTKTERSINKKKELEKELEQLLLK